MSKNENQWGILAQTPDFAHREKFSKDWAKVQSNPLWWIIYDTKCMI